MHLFYFNDCIPRSNNPVHFTERLLLTINEFSELLQKDIQVQRGIVTHDQPSNCYYNNAYNLQQILESITDKSSKDFAYSVFVRFPVGQPHFDDSDDSLIEESYECTVGEEQFNAVNLAIVAKNNGYLFTTAVHTELQHDFIQISVANSGDVISIPNLFGTKPNTQFIENIIRERNRNKLALFERLIELLGAKYSKQFEKDFDELSENSQRLIISHFEDAAKRGMSTPYGVDGDLIKNVTPEKPKCAVSELRIFKDRALRVYFNESPKGIFLASIGFKNNNQQDQNIKQAHNILYKLIVTT